METKIKNKIKCPLCSSTRIDHYWAMKGYKLAKCKVCEMVWDPFPFENLTSQYEKNYFVNENPKGGYANYFEGMKINRRTFYERLKRIEKKFGRKGKLLDIGAALGDCLMEAKKLGWKDITGLEVSKYAVKEAKERGLNVKQGVLNSNTFSNNEFDIVLYQDVIEHITDIVGEVKKVKRILKPGGLLYMVTPDIGGWWHKILGSWWYHYKPGEHVTYFSEKTIRKLYEDAGYKNVETRKTYHVLSVFYILSRLKYYWPWFFETLLMLVKKTPIINWSFKSYTGELESWGYK